MNAFFGFCSYMWFFGTVFCAMAGGTLWEIGWWTAFVVLFSYVGRGVVYTIGFAYKMMYDPAFFHEMIDDYFYYVMKDQKIRDYIEHEK